MAHLWKRESNRHKIPSQQRDVLRFLIAIARRRIDNSSV
jgi:hypothetical protein